MLKMAGKLAVKAKKSEEKRSFIFK